MKDLVKCGGCKEPFKPKKNSTGKYCSNKCQATAQRALFIADWKSGKVSGAKSHGAVSKHIRTYLFGKFDSKCHLCGWCEVNPHTNRIPLDVDHIDGDSTNNSEDNLRLLCPNCHSLTATYKGANRGKGRRSRIKRYHEGKSY